MVEEIDLYSGSGEMYVQECEEESILRDFVIRLLIYLNNTIICMVTKRVLTTFSNQPFLDKLVKNKAHIER